MHILSREKKETCQSERRGVFYQFRFTCGALICAAQHARSLMTSLCTRDLPNDTERHLCAQLPAQPHGSLPRVSYQHDLTQLSAPQPPEVIPPHPASAALHARAVDGEKKN